MSSEYVIHLDGETMKGEVRDFSPSKHGDFTVLDLEFGGTKVKLFLMDKDMERMADLFRSLADDLTTPDNLIAPCGHGLECPCFQAGYEAERRPC